MPRKKGYKHTRQERAAIASGMRTRHEKVRVAMARYYKEKGSPPRTKPDPPSTPVPPSASSISHPKFEQWGLYGFREDGDYYFRHERFDSLIDLQEWMKKVQPPIPRPLWTYTTSGRTLEECFMPIRIPPSALQTLGHRFQQLKEKKK